MAGGYWHIKETDVVEKEIEGLKNYVMPLNKGIFAKKFILLDVGKVTIYDYNGASNPIEAELNGVVCVGTYVTAGGSTIFEGEFFISHSSGYYTGRIYVQTLDGFVTMNFNYIARE